MYKVFVNNKPLTIQKSKSKAEKNIPFLQSSDFDVAVDLLQHNYKSVNIYSPSPEVVWEKFQDNFKTIYAAGGIVFNDKNEMLWIYRLSKWDLPKGKMEKGEKIEETAVREVEEECGISSLAIRKRMPDTFHIYFHKKYILKITHWFEMDYTGNEKLTPQSEEGITDVKWISIDKLDKLTVNTYSNILELTKHYLS